MNVYATTATRLLLAAIFVGSSLAVGCTGPQTTAAEFAPLAPTPLLAPDAIPYDFAWRQEVEIDWDIGSQRFAAVLQKVDGVLQLVGLGPMERPAFLVTYDGTDVTFENYTDREMPFDPRYMIADVQRVSYPWSDAVAPEFSGERTIDTASGALVERYEAGVLVSRSFSRDDAPDRGTVDIRYDGWTGDAPADALLESRWYGYSLRVRTLDAQRVD